MFRLTFSSRLNWDQGKEGSRVKGRPASLEPCCGRPHPTSLDSVSILLYSLFPMTFAL